MSTKSVSIFVQIVAPHVDRIPRNAKRIETIEKCDLFQKEAYLVLLHGFELV